jgi:hypothetical protein
MCRCALLCLLLSTAAMAQTQYGGSAKPAPMAHAGTGCPWLTEGSAAHALGGDASVTVKVAEGEGTCNFGRLQGGADWLEIVVSKAALPVCPAGSISLKGIGNEALVCRHAGLHSESVEMISSRVRDVHFTVKMTARVQKSPARPDDPQNDALEQVAEQVAGNLY